MDMWTFLWVFLSLAILISILESIHRKAKRRRAELAAQQLHEQLRSQPYHVYTIQNSNGDQQQIITPASNAHIIRMDDLPPKYEDLTFVQQTNGTFVASGTNVAAASSSSSPAPSALSAPTPSHSHTTQTSAISAPASTPSVPAALVTQAARF